MVLLPRLPGEPSSVEADPRMLPTLENVKKRSKDRERKKLEGRQRGEQSQESLDERLFPLHAMSASSIAREWSREKHNIVPLYFWAGIMLSMASPFSSFFSISTMSLTPSTTSWTCSTSEEPRRSALEMSNTPPTTLFTSPPSSEPTTASPSPPESSLAPPLSLSPLRLRPLLLTPSKGTSKKGQSRSFSQVA